MKVQLEAQPVKILSVAADDRRKAFAVGTSSGTYDFPYAKLQLPLSPDDRLTQVHVDGELGREAFTYTLDSGREGTVHVDQILDYNRDPVYLADLLLHRLTLEEEKRLKASGIGIRQLARRLKTSPSQPYCLLDTPNFKKSSACVAQGRESLTGPRVVTGLSGAITKYGITRTSQMP